VYAGGALRFVNLEEVVIVVVWLVHVALHVIWLAKLKRIMLLILCEVPIGPFVFFF
jgi:hypothetical protein